LTRGSPEATRPKSPFSPDYVITELRMNNIWRSAWRFPELIYIFTHVRTRQTLGSISAALSSLVYVPSAFGGGLRAPVPSSGWWSSLGRYDISNLTHFEQTLTDISFTKFTKIQIGFVP